jgi:D-sedoheptulose 7-phosphate isomerase
MIDYFLSYQQQLNDALNTVDQYELSEFYDLLLIATRQRIPVLVMGNGGSCAVAEHLTCDWTKGVAHDSPIQYLTTHSLVSNQSLITAIANDYGYDQIFSKQIEYAAWPQAIVLGISSSGNSENIVKGLQAASKKRYYCTALVGFDGGRVVSEKLAHNVTLHVKSYNYGIVEDAHSVIMHTIAQKLRLQLSNDIPTIKL